MKEGSKILWTDTVDSTQEEVKRQLQTLDNLSVIAALFQTAGKGQRGNKWSSGRGENLTFSLLLKPGSDGTAPLKATDQFGISILSAVAVKELLLSKGVSCQIKWPNDIYVGNRKICGMLIENRLDDNGMVADSIIGIGINVNQTVFPPELVNPVSMAKILKKDFDVKILLEEFVEIFRKLLYLPEGELKEKYLDGLYRLGCRAAYTDLITGEEFQGVIRGINPVGKLIVELSDGALKTFSFKEISYII